LTGSRTCASRRASSPSAEKYDAEVIAVTLDLYSHVTPTMQREAASVMNDLLRQ